MKASVFGIREAAGGMCGVGCVANESSPLQHPLTSMRSKIENNPVSSAWIPGVAMVSGALFVTNFRMVFHRAKVTGLIVDRSVVEERKRKNRLQRSYSRSPVRNASASSASATSVNDRKDRSSSSSTSSTKLPRGRSSVSSPSTTNAISNTFSVISEDGDDGDKEKERGRDGDGDGDEDEDEDRDGETSSKPQNDDWIVPLGTVLKVECFGENDFGAVKVNVPTLGVLTKDGRAVKFVMPFALGNTHELCLKFGKKLEQATFKDVVVPGSAWGGEWGGDISGYPGHNANSQTSNFNNDFGVRGGKRSNGSDASNVNAGVNSNHIESSGR